MSSLFSGKNLFFVNFDYELNFFKEFEKKLKPIDLILLDKTESQEEFQKRYLGITDFIDKKQVCVLSPETSPEKAEHLLRQSFNFGIILGSNLSGKKALSKELKKHLNFEVICVKTIMTKIQKKREEEGEEPEEPEEVELDKDSQNLLEEEKEEMMEEIKRRRKRERNYQKFKDAFLKIKNYMQMQSHREFLIRLDPSDLPWEFFSFLIETLSTPKYILFLSVTLETFLTRYKNENSLDDIEEQELPVLTKAHSKFKKLKDHLIKECQHIDFLNFIEFNNDIPFEQAKENVIRIFQKDLLFFIDRLDQKSHSISISTESEGIADKIARFGSS